MKLFRKYFKNEEGKYKHLISAFIITQRIMGK